VRKQRFHLGLYPLPDMPFNRARSRNKLLEHGIVGAVGIYDRAWRAADILSDQAIFAADNEKDWTQTLSSALERPESLRHLMLQGRPILDRLNDPSTQRCFWSELLDVTF
jgi:hypothetical protein